jgi:hypothetical protein
VVIFGIGIPLVVGQVEKGTGVANRSASGRLVGISRRRRYLQMIDTTCLVRGRHGIESLKGGAESHAISD